jgi:DNA-binding transcriptional regulator YiaG
MDASLIREAREKVGESQAAFGARFGVDQSTIHRWETDGPPSRGPARKAIERELSMIGEAAVAGAGGIP